MGEQETSPQHLRRLLLPTDFSATASVALQSVIHIAQSHLADVQILHALEEFPNAPGLHGRQARSDEMLAETVGRVECAGVSVTGEIVYGRPWRRIVAAAEDGGVDLIVQGARGQALFPLAPLGHTAERVARTARIPVLTVHPTDVDRPFGASSIVVAVDFGAGAQRAMVAALRLVRPIAGAGPLILVHARSPEIPNADAALAAMAAANVSADMDVEIVLADGNPGEVVLDVVRERDAAMVALGTRGDGSASVRLGHTALHLLHHAPCPVLTVHRR